MQLKRFGILETAAIQTEIELLDVCCSWTARLRKQVTHVIHFLRDRIGLSTARAARHFVSARLAQVGLIEHGQLEFLGERDGEHRAHLLTTAAEDASAVADVPGDERLIVIQLHGDGVGRTGDGTCRASDAELLVVLRLSSESVGELIGLERILDGGIAGLSDLFEQLEHAYHPFPASGEWVRRRQ